MASESEVLGRIRALVEEEHELRSSRERDEISAESERRQLKAIEVERDQCWDLLRRRRALRESGQDPDTARPRSSGQVEGYVE